MSELVECLDGLTAENILKRALKTANGTPFYLQTLGAGGFCAEYQRIYDDLSGIGTPPSDAIAAAQNTMVCGLIDDGVWQKLDIFYLFAQTTNAGGEALMNWITTGFFNAVAFNVPAFVALEGFTGNGANTYINCNWNPTVNGVNYIQNSASAGCYIRNNVAEATNDFGIRPIGADGPSISLSSRTPINNSTIRLNVNNTQSESNANNDSRGMFILRRIVANEQDIFRNRIEIVSGVNASTGVPNDDMYVLGSNNTGVLAVPCSRQLSCFFAGGGFTQGNVDDMTTRFETYMDSNGKGVIP